MKGCLTIFVALVVLVVLIAGAVLPAWLIDNGLEDFEGREKRMASPFETIKSKLSTSGQRIRSTLIAAERVLDAELTTMLYEVDRTITSAVERIDRDVSLRDNEVEEPENRLADTKPVGHTEGKEKDKIEAILERLNRECRGKREEEKQEQRDELLKTQVTSHLTAVVRAAMEPKGRIERHATKLEKPATSSNPVD